ncbi:MAG: S9 family peptidase [Burkholderiaceae bacterium]|nr:S9 family peptidase [Burkholderiaceae bacterium]
MNKHSFSSLFAFLLLLCASLHAFAADSKPSVESFFNDPEIRAVALSPQGHYVAIVARNFSSGQVVAVRSTADLTKVTAVASTDGDPIVAVHWVNENRLTFTVQNSRLEFESNLDEIAVDRDGSNLTHLISGNWRHNQENLSSSIKDKTLTADYAFYSTLNDGSDDIVVRKYIFDNVDHTVKTTHLYRLNTKTGALSDLSTSNTPHNVYAWELDENGMPRLASSHVKGRCIVSYLAPGSNEWAEIDNADCYKDRRFIPVFLDGANRLFVRSEYRGHDALFSYDLKKKEMASEPFLTVDGFDFLGSPEVDQLTNKVLGIHFTTDARSTVWLDPHFKEIQKKVDSTLKSTTNTITCGADCLNSPVVLVISRSDRQPTQYFIYTVASGAMVGFGGTHPAIKPAQMGVRDFYRYPARDGLSIPAYVTMPPGKASGPLPTVVLVHGGPYLRGASWEWEGEAQFLASRGYVVIQPEFRGSWGFGNKHFKAGWKQWGRSMQDDLADAAKWSIQKGWSDPKRIAIMGASYGGYATLMGLIKNPELFRCGVEWAGVTDIDMMFTSVESDASLDSLNYDMKTLVGDPVADAAIFKETSPLENAAKLTQPILLAHGVEDRRVPIAHATAFRSAVSKNNANVEWIVYSNEGHGWWHQDDRIDFWKHVETFLDKNL